jgi:hypothetical protein
MQIFTTEREKKEGIAEDDSQLCNHCKNKPAEIFQINGEYCLDCWQTITHTNA